MGRPKGSRNTAAGGKREKDPNRPKRPTSAYFYYAAKCREDNAKKGIKITRVADFTKEVSAKWNGLAAKDKEPYEKLAAKDKQRYDLEKANYTGGKVKDANKPKRPQTAYFLFLADFRVKMKGKIKVHKEVLVAAGEAWKALSDTDRKPYNLGAVKEKEKYEERMAEYRKTGGAPPAKKAKVEAANGTDEEDDVEEEEDDEEEEEEEDEDDE